MGVRGWGLEKCLTLPGLLGDSWHIVGKGDSGSLRACLNVLSSPSFWVSDSVSLSAPLLSGSLRRNLGPQSPPQRSTPSSSLDLLYSWAPLKAPSLFPVH